MNGNHHLSGGVETVTLKGELTVEHASDLKISLRSALERADQVGIRFEEVTAMDISCLQLLCSVHRTASHLNKQIRILDDKPSVFYETLERAGFKHWNGCSHKANIQCLFSRGDS